MKPAKIHRAKREKTDKRGKPRGKTSISTGYMPYWMRQYLRSVGVDEELDFALLDQTQRAALESAERLWHLETQGLILVIFDPETAAEPRVELTDYGREKLQRNEYW
jgi:hypothetical protein